MTALAPAADLLLTGARLWSGGGVPAGADAVATREGRIIAVGPTRDLEALRGPTTRTIPCEGRTVTPGFTDAHVHFVWMARNRARVSLRTARSRDEALRSVSDYVARHPELRILRGYAWDANPWSEPPDRASLDRVTGDRPALLDSHDCHSLWVNGAALRAAGVTRATPDPAGGRIERDASGEPTGVVRENAVKLFQALAASGNDFASDLDAARAAAAECLALGITGVHVFEGAEEQRVLAALARGDGPRVRVLIHLALAGLDGALSAGITSGTGDDWFRIGAVKLFADGALGSRTAAMLEPYEGESQSGIETLSRSELRDLVAKAARGGISPAIHAIGDRANRHALDAIQALEGPRRLALPPRIEHAQIVSPADLPRFAALGVVASMQPIHCTSDMELADRHWGERSRTSYAWRSLLDSGAMLAFGSDAPVEPIDPMAGVHAAVTRQRADGTPPGGWRPAQALVLEPTLAAYTAGPAHVAGETATKGRLARGYVADLVVWSADLARTAPAELHAVRADLTVCCGAIVHERAGASALSSGA